MSRIVRADFAQLLPERVAALTPLGDNRSAITLRGPAGMGWLGTTKLVGMGLTRSVTATVQRLDDGKDPDLDWAEVNSPVELKYALTPTVPADVTWSAMLPGLVRQDGSSYRVLLQEFEFHRADETATPHPFDGKESWTNDEIPRKYWVGRRLVYADTFTL